MIEITYTQMLIFISVVWLSIRAICWIVNAGID